MPKRDRGEEASVRVETDDGRGRHTLAAVAVADGDALFRGVTPVAAALEVEYRHSRCHVCFCCAGAAASDASCADCGTRCCGACRDASGGTWQHNCEVRAALKESDLLLAALVLLAAETDLTPFTTLGAPPSPIEGAAAAGLAGLVLGTDTARAATALRVVMCNPHGVVDDTSGTPHTVGRALFGDGVQWLNHGCAPSAALRTPLAPGAPVRAQVLARGGTAAGGELTLPYVPLMAWARTKRRVALNGSYGFWCQCTACAGTESDDDAVAADGDAAAAEAFDYLLEEAERAVFADAAAGKPLAAAARRALERLGVPDSHERALRTRLWLVEADAAEPRDVAELEADAAAWSRGFAAAGGMVDARLDLRVRRLRGGGAA